MNDVVELNQRLAAELERLGTVVGKEAHIAQRASIGGASGSWAACVESLNSLVAGLVQPTTEVARVIGAAQWQLIEPFIPPERWGGRTRCAEIREVLNGIFYLLRSGCAWRAIPHDFPNPSTCRHYYDRFRAVGTWLIHERLRGSARARTGRHPDPSAAVVDAQSTRTTEKGVQGLRRE